jgi:hypothetical protein
MESAKHLVHTRPSAKAWALGDEACTSAEKYLPNFQDRCCGISPTVVFFLRTIRISSGINACVFILCPTA